MRQFLLQILKKSISFVQHLVEPSLYGQLSLIGISLGLGWIISRIVKKHIRVKATTLVFFKKFFDPWTFFALVWMCTLGFLLPFYYQYVSTDLFLIRNCSILVLTFFIIRLVQKKVNPLLALPLTYFACAFCVLVITGLFKPTLQLLNQVHLKVGFLDTTPLKLLQSVALIALISAAVLRISKKVDLRLAKQENMNKSTQILISKSIKTTLTILAIFASMALVGVDLSLFTFFAGAIGVAIGFGLQNILSNIFCGIILLLDRSIRPGDVVTLADEGTYGVVHKLNARYISIRTREGIEHLIPNESFINKKTENWTHSDPYIRITAAFEVDIETDVALLEKVLIDIAKSTPRVIARPEPATRVTSITQNCIEIKLRVWIQDPENGLSGIKDHIYKKALLAFKENHIQIPRRPIDLYLKNASPYFSKTALSSTE